MPSGESAVPPQRRNLARDFAVRGVASRPGWGYGRFRDPNIERGWDGYMGLAMSVPIW